MRSNYDSFLQPELSSAHTTADVFVEEISSASDGLDDSSNRLASLLAAATAALDIDRRETQRCIRRAAALLGIKLGPGPGGTLERSALQSGLATWQAKRLTSYIDDKLGSRIRVGDLADVVRLSKSHLFRAFRQTFGESPNAYVMKRRMLRAQELMLTSSLALSQIALECGMCDQAHFSRTFRRLIGTNPAVWRRQFLLRPASRAD